MTRMMAQAYRKAMLEGSKVLTDEQAVGVPMLFPRWDGSGVELTAGERICHDGVLYPVLQTHTTQPQWAPDVSASLFARVLIPDPEVIPEWVQPDSTNAYMTGDKVRHNDKVWISLIDNNVWEPGAVGTEALWEEAN